MANLLCQVQLFPYMTKLLVGRSTSKSLIVSRPPSLPTQAINGVRSLTASLHLLSPS